MRESDRDVAGARRPDGRARLRRRIGNAIPTIVALGLIVAAWELFIVVTGEPEYILPPLHRILETGSSTRRIAFSPMPGSPSSKCSSVSPWA